MQRVDRCRVEANGEVSGEIGKGLLVLLGVAEGDTETDVSAMADKVASLRIFPDEAGKMNLSVVDANGEVMVVSQFTLLADTGRGRRPSFVGAAEPDAAQRLYHLFADELRRRGLGVATGVFGARMSVELVNDGPVTIIL